MQKLFYIKLLQSEDDVKDHWKLQETLLKRALKTAKSSDYIECAVEMLRDDIDCDTLFSLAGMSDSDDIEDTEELFLESLERLHISLPLETQLLIKHLNEVASRIISRETPATDGLKELIEINKTVHSESITSHFQLANFDMLDQIIQQGEAGSEFLPSHFNLTSEIIKEVALFREGFQYHIPSTVMNTMICTDCNTRMIPKIVTPKQTLLNKIFNKNDVVVPLRICSNCGSKSLIQVTTEEGRKYLFKELKEKHT